MKKRLVGIAVLLVCGSLVSGCLFDGDGADKLFSSFLAVSTTDWSTGGASRVNLDTATGFRVKDGADAIDSDIGGMDVVAEDGRTRAFVVGRGEAIVYKFDVVGGMDLLDSFTVGANFWTSNPQDILIVSERKAYVSRYGEDDILIFDPRDGSRKGNIPLSAYATNGDGLARPADLIMVKGKVFAALQNLDAGFDYCDDSIENGIIAVIDPKTDSVETTVALNTADPTRLIYAPAIDRILIASAGQYATLSAGCSVYDADPDVTVSGLEIMDPKSPYTITTVIMGDHADVNGNIFDVALSGTHMAYILVAEGFRDKDRALRIDLGAGAVDTSFRYPASPGGYDDLSGIATALGLVFIGDRPGGGICVHNVYSDAQAGFVALASPPMAMQLMLRGD